jgi:hypothetical protein
VSCAVVVSNWQQQKSSNAFSRNSYGSILLGFAPDLLLIPIAGGAQSWGARAVLLLRSRARNQKQSAEMRTKKECGKKKHRLRKKKMHIPACHSLHIIFCLSYSACPNLPVLFYLYFLWHVQPVPLWLSCPGYPVLTISWLSCPGYLVLIWCAIVCGKVVGVCICV